MNEPTSVAPPAGWYPDETGKQRWWDGTSWGTYAPPPAPTDGPRPSTGWMVAGWLGAFLLPILGGVAGIVLITRKHTAQGIVMLVVAIVMALVWADYFATAAVDTSSTYQTY